MNCLNEASIWEEYYQSLHCFEFILTWRVYFDIVLHCARVCNAVHRVIGWWVPSTVVTFISVLY